jgi:hypothetical protein
MERSAEFGECVPDPTGVLDRGLHPDVQVSSDPGHSLRGEGVGTDDEKAHAGIHESDEEVAEVADHVLSA